MIFILQNVNRNTICEPNTREIEVRGVGIIYLIAKPCAKFDMIYQEISIEYPTTIPWSNAFGEYYIIATVDG